MNTEFEYMNALSEILEKIYEVNKETIKDLTNIFAKNIMEDHIIHVFGSGHSHMIGMELFARAGGLGNVNAILDPDVVPLFGADRSGKIERIPEVGKVIFENYDIEKEDIVVVVSNSGRNAIPVDFALCAKEKGIFTIAVTSLQQSKNMTGRHPSGKRLFEVCDVVLDSCVPHGDGCLNIDGMITGPVSTIAGMFIMNTIITEAIKVARKQGGKPYIYQSYNVDNSNNDELVKHFKGRIRNI